MTKKYKDLAADLLRQGRNVTMDLANSTIDFVADLPVRTADHAERVRSNMTSKAEVVATTIEAKILLEDRLMGEIDDAEFAYRMVQDDNLRKTVKLLTQQVLDSDPKRIEPKADGSFLNFGAGVSTFWEELQRKTPIERENAVEIEQVLLNLESGFDEDIAPDTRKLFLREAGLTPEQVDDFVPLSEYIIYETKMMDQVRDQVRADLDMGTDKPLSEAEQLVVDAVSEDRMYAGNKPVRDGYLRGKYEGQSVDIKGSWSSHTFTDEEAAKLFAGETIDFDYTKKNGKTGHASGKLEWQSYQGREFLGFHADFSKKQAPKQEQPDTILPYSAASETAFSDQPIYDAPSYEETYGISAQDLYTMFSNGDGHIPDPETWTDAPIDDQEWQQIMELSGAEDNYQVMLNGSIEENMMMLAELEAKEQVQAKGLALDPADLPFPPQELHDEVPSMMGISDADLAFAEQYAHEMDESFGISDADLAFAAQFDQPQQ